MSLRSTSLAILDMSVSAPLATRCQKYKTRRGGRRTRAEDCVRSPVEDRSQQGKIIVGIVFQVSVLDDRHVARHVPDGRADGRALAAVPLVAEGADAGLGGGQLLQFLPRDRRTTVVDTDEFQFQRKRNRKDSADDCPQRPALLYTASGRSVS